MKRGSPIDPFIEKHGVLILDGGLATELERMGHDLDHPLWSARIMKTDPRAIREVHLSYLNAGADCIISASYQASFAGCIATGMTENQVITLLEGTVTLACEARDEYVENIEKKDRSGIDPIVAASVGPYGAYLANGAEYTGDYGVSTDELYDFHARRWEVLSGSKADLLACETVPSYQEAEALLKLIQHTPETYTYVCFSCKDGTHINDGTPIRSCVELFEDCDQVVAVGINCTAPTYITELINNVREGSPGKAIVVYPNSGETYNATSKSWVGESEPVEFGGYVGEWAKIGARMIGGCCRTGPQHIKAISEQLR